METVKLETLKEHQARTGKDYPDSLQCARGNVQRELKAAFPGVKFSIRTSRFSGGNDLNVEWTDGPTEDEVKAIVNKYSGGHFDGMIDLYEYNTGADRDFTKTYGDAKYTFTNRRYSAAALQEVASYISNKYRIAAPEIVTEKDGTAYIAEEGLNVSTKDYTWDYFWMSRQVIRREIGTLTAAQIQTLNVTPPDYATAANGCEIPL